MSSLRPYLVELETRFQVTLELEARDEEHAKFLAKRMAQAGEGANVLVNGPEVIGVQEL